MNEAIGYAILLAIAIVACAILQIARTLIRRAISAHLRKEQFRRMMLSANHPAIRGQMNRPDK